MHKISVLKNQYSRATRNSIFVKNTDNFDAVMYIVCTLYIDDERFKEFYDKKCSNEISKYIETYLKYGAKQQTYLNRTEVLKQHFEICEKDGLKVLDCGSWSIIQVVETWLGDVLNINCTDWKKSVQVPTEVTGEPNSSNLIILNGGDSEISFESFEKAIHVNGTMYHLRAIVEKKSDHYVAHVLRGMQWYTYGPLNEGPVNLPAKAKIKGNVLVYRIPNTQHDLKTLFPVTSLLSNYSTDDSAGTLIVVSQACGPNAAIHCLCAIFSKEMKIDDYIQEADENLVNTIKSFNSGDMKAAHSARNALLRTAFKSTFSNGREQINCYGNVTDILRAIITPSFPSIRTIFSCKCPMRIINRPSIDLDYTVLDKEGLQNVNECLDKTFLEEYAKKECITCHTEQIITNTIGDIVVLDVQPVSNSNTRLGIFEPTNLHEIQKEIKVCKKTFFLKAAISHVSNGDGHYVAHVLHQQNWIELDDLGKFANSKCNTLVNVHLLMYIKSNIQNH